VVGNDGDLAPEPTFRAHYHLLSIVSDAHNFAGIDCKSLLAYAYISSKTAADHTWFRWFFLEPMVYFILVQSYAMPIHAACVAKNGRGILLSGASGAGKSTLAFACARAGWTFISDDATSLLMDSEDRIAIGKPHQARVRDDAPRLFPELEGYCTRARPNGKLSIEVLLQDFPQIRTALHCRIDRIVFVDRGPGRPGFERVPSEEMAAAILDDMPSYGPEVRARHEKTMSRLLDVPAYRLRYERLEDALVLLEELQNM